MKRFSPDTFHQKWCVKLEETKKRERRIVAFYKERLKTSAWKGTQRRRAQKVRNYFRKDEGETICYYFSQDKI